MKKANVVAGILALAIAMPVSAFGDRYSKPIEEVIEEAAQWTDVLADKIRELLNVRAELFIPKPTPVVVKRRVGELSKKLHVIRSVRDATEFYFIFSRGMSKNAQTSFVLKHSILYSPYHAKNAYYYIGKGSRYRRMFVKPKAVAQAEEIVRSAAGDDVVTDIYVHPDLFGRLLPDARIPEPEKGLQAVLKARLNTMADGDIVDVIVMYTPKPSEEEYGRVIDYYMDKDIMFTPRLQPPGTHSVRLTKRQVEHLIKSPSVQFIRLDVRGVSKKS